MGDPVVGTTCIFGIPLNRIQQMRAKTGQKQSLSTHRGHQGRLLLPKCCQQPCYMIKDSLVLLKNGSCPDFWSDNPLWKNLSFFLAHINPIAKEIQLNLTHANCPQNRKSSLFFLYLGGQKRGPWHHIQKSQCPHASMFTQSNES